MLLINVDDVLKLTDSDIKHNNGECNDNKYTFFDTDKFTNTLDTIKKGTFITSDMLSEIFKNSFTEGYLDYSGDLK